MIQFPNVKNVKLRRLEGFIETSPLWKESLQNLFFQFEIPDLQIDETNFTGDVPEKLYLGKRAEIYLETILESSKRYRVISKNLQVIEAKRTLGELDFLIFDAFKQETLHIEQVYKFYVYDPISNSDSHHNELNRWIGPNRKDRLVDKLHKLKTHQMPLLQHPTTVANLEMLRLNPETIFQKLCFKAHCFVPKGFNSKAIQQINNDCISGYYINLNDFTASEYETFQFAIPRKIDWPINPKYCEEWLDFKTAKENIKIKIDEKRAPLVWLKTKHDFERLFVVWW